MNLYNIFPDAIDEEFETTHLLLRPYQEADAADFMRLLQESAAMLKPAFGGRLARVCVPEDARLQLRQLRTQ